MTEHRFARRRFAIIVSAVSIILLGVVFGFASEMLPPVIQQGIQDAVAEINRIALVFVVVGLIVFYRRLSSWLQRSKPDPNGGTDRDHMAADRDVEVFEQRAAAVDPAAYKLGNSPAQIDDPVRESLREVLRNIYSRQEIADVQRYLNEGQWTADPYAAAFLSTSDDVAYPLRHRLYAWLYPRSAYEFRIQRALTAVETVCESELLDSTSPEREYSRFEALRERLHSLGQGRAKR